MAATPRELCGNINPANSSQMRQFARDAAHLIQRERLTCRVTNAAQGGAGLPVLYTVQVINRRNADVPGVHVVLVYLESTSGGGIESNNIVAFPTGTVLETLVVEGAWRVLTTDTGSFSMSVAANVPGSRFVRTVVQSTTSVSREVVHA